MICFSSTLFSICSVALDRNFYACKSDSLSIVAGEKLAVCSAATKSSVILCLENLIGLERFQGLDCFLAGDDVKEKKPDPSIYLTASKKLGIPEKDCLVVEDSVIGLQAATKAGMSCVITYTSSTADQDFKDAIATYPDLSNIRLKDLELLLQMLSLPIKIVLALGLLRSEAICHCIFVEFFIHKWLYMMYSLTAYMYICKINKHFYHKKLRL
ncbi:haloacid dehalogenase-like hydrolase domain-containing protein [Prunus yedoensis var. nudiflora]|uniref:Haloacid dehalogenase-like hydrolase domain-containing protein n=1 Tax=Prunus yedoensis var. nudiflora TaxID=2094558 RepID=A0A314U7S1_PRUYE|nr:haloacid dehalogenase-like hydrolase domain-containing protein [Prunus yedoensis var. nudiflora]